MIPIAYRWAIGIFISWKQKRLSPGLSPGYPLDEKGNETGKKSINTGLEDTPPNPPQFEMGIGKIYKLSDNIVRLTLPKDTCPSGNKFMRHSLPRPVITGFVEFLDGELTAKDFFDVFGWVYNNVIFRTYILKYLSSILMYNIIGWCRYAWHGPCQVKILSCPVTVLVTMELDVQRLWPGRGTWKLNSKGVTCMKHSSAYLVNKLYFYER